MRYIAIIPARYHSKRLKAKALINILGKSLIRRVYEKVVDTGLFDTVIVATDDDRIVNEVEGFGGNVKLTAQTHRSGTDRCAEIIQTLKSEGEVFDVVVNVQGDEPGIGQESLSALLNLFHNNHISIATLITPIFDHNEWSDPSIVKVVKSKENVALYFSRFAIPFIVEKKYQSSNVDYFQHIGVYAFKPDTLLELSNLPASSLEIAESLEQLRWLENDYRIYLSETKEKSIGIDTQDDLNKFINILKSEKGF